MRGYSALTYPAPYPAPYPEYPDQLRGGCFSRGRDVWLPPSRVQLDLRPEEALVLARHHEVQALDRAGGAAPARLEDGGGGA